MPLPNGWRVSSERRAEGDERVRWTRVLGRPVRQSENPARPNLPGENGLMIMDAACPTGWSSFVGCRALPLGFQPATIGRQHRRYPRAVY